MATAYSFKTGLPKRHREDNGMFDDFANKGLCNQGPITAVKIIRPVVFGTRTTFVHEWHKVTLERFNEAKAEGTPHDVIFVND